jgi:hypothetical protein
MIWLVVVVALVLVGFVALRVVQGSQEKKWAAEKFVPRRKWGWEKALGDAEEIALLQGLEAYEKAGARFNIGDRDGLLSLYGDRPARVSLFLLGERFKALGPAALGDPAGAVKGLIDGFLAREEPGVLHLRPEWFPEGGVDGWNNDQLTEEARKVLDSGSAAGLQGLHGWYSDENVGVIHLGILARPGPELSALRDAGKFEELQAAETLYVNHLVVDLARTIDRHRALRGERPELAPPAALKIALVEIVNAKAPGATWSRVPPHPDEVAIARASVEGEGRPAAT